MPARETNPFTVASEHNETKQIKPDWNNFNQEDENFKTLKKFKTTLNRKRDLLCSWVGEIKSVKMAIIPKAIYRFSAISIKIPIPLFIKI
jgi:vacuolar-type H+-ATPase subunit D/Vma8